MSARLALLLAAAALSFACTPADDQAALAAQAVGAEAPANAAPLALSPKDLPSFFNCLRDARATIVSAHRGGPQPGFPENALETLQHTLAAAPVALEIDISRTRDGVLVLMHDDTLERTSTGAGILAEKSFAEIADLRLQDRQGQVTDFAIPRLEDVLRWAKGRAILQLDVKRGVPFADVVAAVHDAGAEENALIITYNERDAAEVSALDPGLYVSTQARTRGDVAGLRQAGVALGSVGAWTGTDAPDPEVFAALAAQGLEPFFGTLGRPGERLDDVYAAQGGTGWARLSQAGVALIASDRPIEAFAALDAADGPGVKWAACLLAKQGRP